MNKERSIAEILAMHGDKLAQRHLENTVYRRASLGDKQAIEELKRLGWSDDEIIANQVLELFDMGLNILANQAWVRLVKNKEEE